MTAVVALVVQLRLRPWLYRVMLPCALFVIAVVYVAVLGVEISKVRQGEEVHKMLQKYNANSGFIMTLADEPMRFAVRVFVPVWMVLVVQPVTKKKTPTHWDHVARIGVLVARVALTAAVTNALASFNVQQTHTSVHGVMNSSDAVAPASELQSLLHSADANKSTVNTIFQSLLIPRRKPMPVKCTAASGRPGSPNSTPVVGFDLRTRPIYADIVPNAVAPEQESHFRFGNKDTIDQNAISKVSLPSNTTTTAYLLALAARLHGGATEAQAQVLVQDDELGPLSSQTLSAFTSIFFRQSFSNGSVVNDGMKISFSRTRLSPHIVFEAVTLELQRSREYFRTKLCNNCLESSNPNSSLFQMTLSNDACGHTGCVIGEPSTAEVTAHQLCDYPSALAGKSVPCDLKRRGNMIVSSTGQKLQGQEMLVQTASSPPSLDSQTNMTKQVVIVEPKAYSIATVGILTWEFQDLAATFNVSCEPNADCTGIIYNVPQSQSNTTKSKLPRSIIAVPQGILSANLPPILGMQQVRLATVSSNALMPVTPSNFRDSHAWKGLEGNECMVDQAHGSILSRHQYIEDTLQVAYTGGMMYLFQNARVFMPVAIVSTRLAGQQTLDFSGNRYYQELRVSIPTTSAIVSIVGCVMLLLMVGTIVRGASHIHNNVSKNAVAANIVQVLVDNRRFPKSLLRCKLGDGADCQKLTSFEIVALQVQDQDNTVMLDQASPGFDDDLFVPVGHQSKAKSTRESMEWADDIPLRVSIRRTVLVIAALVLLSAYVALLVSLMGDGQRLITVPGGRQGKSVEQYVQDYNFFLGTIGAALAVPAELLLSALVSLLSLFFATPPRMTRVLLLAMKATAIWSLTSAINSINVQPGSTHIEPYISKMDLNPRHQYQQQPAANESGSTALYSIIYGTNPAVEITCSMPELEGKPEIQQWRRRGLTRPVPHFAFSPKEWHKDFLWEVRDAQVTATFNRSSSTMNDSDLPFETETAAFIVSSFYQAVSPETNTSTSRSWSRDKEPASVFIKRALLASEDRFPNQQLTLSRYQLTDNVEYLAVSLTYNSSSRLRTQNFGTAATTPSPTPSVETNEHSNQWELDVDAECTAAGCALPVQDDNHVNFSQEHVIKAWSFCGLENAATSGMSCNMLNASKEDNMMVVTGTSRNIVGDGMKVLSSGNVTFNSAKADIFATYRIRLMNPTVRTTETMGILRWVPQRLADRFGADCHDTVNKSECDGLLYPLRNSSEVLLVGKKQLPVNQLRMFDTSSFVDTELIKMKTGSGAFPILRPADFKETKWNQLLITGTDCCPVTEDYIKYVEQNHFYPSGEAIIHEAYIAAMFYLFDNARKYTFTAVSPSSGNKTLNFDGNVQIVHIGATIPKQAAIVSTVATAMMLAMSLYVVLADVITKGKKQAVTMSTVHRTAEVMFDGAQYPKNFLAVHIAQCDAMVSTNGQLYQLQQLDYVQLDHVRLESRPDVSSAATTPLDAQEKTHWEFEGSRSRTWERWATPSEDSTSFYFISRSSGDFKSSANYYNLVTSR